MRNLINICFVGVLFACVSQVSDQSKQKSAGNYDIEDKICDCIIQSYDSIGFSIIDTLNVWHNFLVNSGQIDDKSSQSLYNIYVSAESSNSLGYVDTSVLAKREFNLSLNPFNTCVMKYYDEYKDSSDSKIIRLINAQKALGMNVTVSKVAKTVLDNLEVDDFSHDYYKYTLLYKTWLVSVEPVSIVPEID